MNSPDNTQGFNDALSWCREQSEARGRRPRRYDPCFDSSAGSDCRAHSLPRNNPLDWNFATVNNPSSFNRTPQSSRFGGDFRPSDYHSDYNQPNRYRQNRRNYGINIPSEQPSSYHHNQHDHGINLGPQQPTSQSSNMSGYSSMPAGEDSMQYENQGDYQSGAHADEERRYPTDDTICGLHPVAFTALAITGMAYEKAKIVVETALMCPIVTGWLIGTHYSWIQN